MCKIIRTRSWVTGGLGLLFSALTLTAAEFSVRIGGAPQPATNLVTHSEVWRFRRGTSEPPADWHSRADAALDASWESGPGGFGFADGDDGTVLSDMRNNYTTVYIRKSFTVSSLETNQALRLVMDWDDGFVAYLDGVEIARSSNAGSPGSFLPYNSGVNPDHPASVDSGLPAEIFSLGAVGTRLAPGTHILALQGLNGDIASSDVTLKADLSVAGPEGGGSAVFDGLFALVRDASVVLSGTNTFGGATRVTVNGLDASFNAGLGSWSKLQELRPGMNRLFIATVDSSGNILASTNKDIVFEATATGQGGLINSSVTWTKAMGVVRVTNDLTVASGGSLTIEPGVVVLLSGNTSLRVRTNSVVNAIGTELEPIFFLPANGTTPWGELSALGEEASLNIRFGEMVAGQVRILRDALITIEDSVLRDLQSRQMVEGLDGEQLIFRRCHFNRYAQTHIDYTDALVEDCLFENISSDAMDFAGNPAAIIVRRCTWRNGIGANTDAIDLGDNRGVRIEDCIIHDFPDKAISIAEGSHDTVVRNVLIYNVGSGVNMYASTNGIFSHVTVANSGYGLRLYVRDGFNGPGHASSTNIISWHNAIPLEVTNNGSLLLSYSDIEGTAPFPGEGNLAVDPLFVEQSEGDYRLNPGSPARGSGLGGVDMGVLFPVGGIPPAPFNFSAHGQSADSILLRWQEDADNEAGFVVYRSTDGTNWAGLASLASDATSYTDMGLPAAQQYFYQVRATNHSGNSRLSNLAAASTQAPSVPYTIVGGALVGDTAWTTAMGTILVLSNVVVPANVTLTINQGTQVRLTNGASIVAQGGSILVAGTAGQKVVFEPYNGTNYWGQLAASGLGSSLTIRHADIRGGSVSFLTDTIGLLEDSHLHDYFVASPPILFSMQADALTVRRSHMAHYHETLFRYTLVLIEDSLFEFMTNPSSDGIDLDFAPPGSTIRRSTVRNGPQSNTDCIDIGSESQGVIIQDCMLYNTTDKGISIGESSFNIMVSNCLIYGADIGISIKDSCTAQSIQNTITDCNSGYRLNLKTGTMGGHLTNAYNNIVWGNNQDIVLLDGATAVSDHSDFGDTNFPGMGNIRADPMFVSPAGGDYRLLPGSPALQTGRAGASMGVVFPVGGLPTAPTNLIIAARQPGQVTLSWGHTNAGQSGFIVEHSSNGVTWCACTVAGAGAASAIVTDTFASGITYLFRIKATNFIGASFYSNVASTSLDPNDNDGDGIPNAWEIQYGLDPGNAADATQDADGDGANNRDEFRAGTLPNDAASVLQINQIIYVGLGEIELHFEALADRAYSLEYRNSLATGTWLNLIDIPSDSFPRTFTVTDFPPGSAKARFYRLIIP